MSRKWPTTLVDNVFPDGREGNERALRRAMFEAWARSAGEFRYQLLIAADWFADRGHPDEAVCRAAWEPRRVNAKHPTDPGAWWCWSARPPQPHGWSVGRACFASPSHNSRLWLCWPRGWVRFTGGYDFRDGCEPVHRNPKDDRLTVPGAWCLTIQPHATKYGTPAIGRHGRAEWTKLFHPHDAVWGEGERVMPKAQPTLFDAVA